MPKSTKSVIFSIIVLAATAFATYFLNQLDQIVHGQLYNYGLLFNSAWADPYWNTLRIIQILLAIAAAATGINLALSIKRDFVNKKPAFTQRSQKTISQVPTMPRTVERQMAPPPQKTATLNAPIMRQTTSPAQPGSVAPVAPVARTTMPQQFSSEASGPMRCPHCNKAFTQPLRMLDFQGDRPRIVNICPFCNEIIQTAAKPENQEDERHLLRRRNNHTLRAATSQPTG